MIPKGKLVFSIAKYKRWELKNVSNFRADWIYNCNGLTQDEFVQLGYKFTGDTWFVHTRARIYQVKLKQLRGRV